MKLKLEQRAILFTVVSFAIYLVLKPYFSTIKVYLDQHTQNGLVSYMLTYAILSIPILLGTYFINQKVKLTENLGLNRHPFQSFFFPLLFSLPMLLGGLIFFKLNREISIANMIAGTIVVGFVEELFFRGFLFGQIFKYTRLGFISAILIGALIFASGHLYQSQESMELLGIFLVTFMGAILFAWLYVEWDYNLWIPIYLHALMNLAWYVFDMDDTALGGILPNVFRGLTITFAIVFTIFYKKRHQKKMTITIGKLIKKNL